MNKSELIAKVAEESGLSKADSERALNAYIDTVQNQVASGDEVSITGFGTFKGTPRAARNGRNPKTGEAIKIAATTSPSFSAGKTFKEAVAVGASTLKK